ncbi:MAG: XRE family transcriptional regulator [Ruminococcus sp.]|jgi:Zn-dependent peptidase ImmA (M78 family)|nr:XRE family transcriptional regulator [Ruminococcus sp.]
MKDLKSFNGKRLKIARTLKGMSIAELAEALDLQRQTVSMYENGKISIPDFPKVQEMSKILNFPIDFFLDSDTELVNVAPSTYFRSLLTTNKKYRYEQEIKIKFVSTIYSYLSDYITFPQVNLPEVCDGDDIEDIAMKLRKCWDLGYGPIDNLIFHAEQNGIILTSFSTSTNDIDAFSQKFSINDEDRFIVALSQNKSTAARLHFDVAHELGHIMLHDWEDDIESILPSEFRDREQQANDFASAFLLPKDTFLKEVGTYADKLNYYIELKKKWKVSIAAMIRRSKTLGLITYDKYQSLMRQMQKMGIRKCEPLDDILVTAKPSLLKTAVEMLINDNVLTPKEILQELSDEYNLSLYSDDIETLLGLSKGTLKTSNVIPVHFLGLKS